MALTRITKGVIKPNENYDTHNINSTGIVTAIGLDINGNADISGNLSVGGVLTYEDVTSIDSVGVITARQGIHVGAGVSAVGVGTFGSLDIGGDIDVDGHTNLDNVSIAGVTTTTDNIHIGTRTHTANSSTALKNIHMGSEFWNGTAGDHRALKLIFYGASGQPSQYGLGVSNNTLELQSNNSISFYAGGVSGDTKTRRLQINGAGNYLFDSGTLYIQDKIGHYNNTTTNIRFPTNNTISFETAGTQRLNIAPNGNISVTNDLDVDGHTNLDNVSVAGVTTFSGGVTVNSSLDLNGDIDVDGHTNLDNVNIAGVTTSGHLTINGDLTVNDNYPSIYLKDYDSDSDFMLQNQNGIFTVYDATNNADRFEITSTGTVRAPHLTLQSTSPALTFNDSNHDSDFMIQNANGLLKIYDNTNNANRFGVNSSGSVFVYGDELYIGDSIIHHGDIDTKIRFPAADTISFDTAGDERLRITSNGNIEVQGTRAGSLQTNDDDALKLYTKSTSADINRGVGITFYTHDGSGYEMGGTIQVAKETAGANNPASYMRFSTQSGSTTTERLRIDSTGKLGLGMTPDTWHTNNQKVFQISGTNAGLNIFTRAGSHHLSSNFIYNSSDAGVFQAASGYAMHHAVSATNGTFDWLSSSAASSSAGSSATMINRLRIDSNGNMGLGTLLASDPGSAGAGLKIEKYVQRNNIYAFPDGYYGASLGEVQNTENKVWASIDSHYARSSAISAGLFLSAFHQDAGGSGCGAAIKNLKVGNALTFSTVTTGASVGTVAVETERLRIASDGKVLIGNGTFYSPSGMLHIVGDNNSNGPELYLMVPNNNATDNIGALVFGNNIDKSICMIRGTTHTANNTGEIQFHTSTTGTMSEKLRITSHGGTVVNKGGTPNTASGWAGLEVKAAASEHQLVLSSTDTASNSNQVRLGFKLHPSNDNERVKAAIVCQGSGGGYGEVSRMMFCIDSVADNGNALPNSASDEKLRITSSGLIQIGGDISNVADIDTSNTKLTIKQSANSKEDGIYIERSGERRGHYIYVGGAHGTNDALCFSTNQLGTDTDILALDRSGAAYLGGSFYPNGDNNHDIGSDAKTWRKFYIQNMYPDQGTEQSTSGSSFASSTYYDVGYERGNMGGIDLNGTYIITLYCDNYAAGGGNYGVTYTWIVGMRNQSTNQNTTNEVPLLSVTGHSTNNQLIELRTKREGAVYGGNEWLVWRPQSNLSAINGSSGRTMKWRVQRIGRSSLG